MAINVSTHYELIIMFFYDCSCLEYCSFFGLIANKYVHLCLNWSKSEYGDSRYQKISFKFLVYEIIERVNVLASPKPKSFLCQPIMVVDQACSQEFFRKEVSRNKVTSKNISATTNRQKASEEIWDFFYQVPLKLNFKWEIYQ